MARLGVFDGTAVAMLGIRDWRFEAPIRFGDTIHAEITIDDTRATSDGQRGIIFRKVRLIRQDGVVAQSGELPLLMRRTPTGTSSTA
jgi:acyl dehydratase